MSDNGRVKPHTQSPLKGNYHLIPRLNSKLSQCLATSHLGDFISWGYSAPIELSDTEENEWKVIELA